METNSPEAFNMNPKKFLLWLFVVTIIMFFASLTSAYLVRSSDGDWLHFDLPSMFWISSGVIILSSLTMQLAYNAAAKNEFEKIKIYTIATLLLGIIFLYLQVKGWGQLYANKIYLGGKYSNPAGSFVYVLSLMHGFHLITGIIYLIIILLSALKQSIHSGRLLQIELCTTYWHFLDLLWIYLFVFLQLNN